MRKNRRWMILVGAGCWLATVLPDALGAAAGSEKTAATMDPQAARQQAVVNAIELADLPSFKGSGSPTWVVEATLRRWLERWAAGEDKALDGWSSFHQVIIERQAQQVIDAESVRPWISTDEDDSAWGPPEKAKRPDLQPIPGMPCLLGTQQNTVEDLLVIEPSALLPTASFYIEIFDQQMQAPRRTWFAVHSKNAVYRLADKGLRSSKGSADEGRLTVMLWTALADTLRELRLYEAGEEARQLYYRILKIDPENRLALYGAGYLDEKYGDYRRAAKTFQRLVTLEPDDWEARLRLGVNLRRIGSVTRAEPELQRVTHEGATEWMRHLAFQELAHLYRTADPAKAVQTIERGLEIFPSSTRLRLQMASLGRHGWDEMAEPVDAVESSWQEEVGYGPRGDSARVMYEMAREQESQRARLEWSRQVAELQPVLRRGLQRLASYAPEGIEFEGCEGLPTSEDLTDLRRGKD